MPPSPSQRESDDLLEQELDLWQQQRLPLDPPMEPELSEVRDPSSLTETELGLKVPDFSLPKVNETQATRVPRKRKRKLTATDTTPFLFTDLPMTDDEKAMMAEMEAEWAGKVANAEEATLADNSAETSPTSEESPPAEPDLQAPAESTLEMLPEVDTTDQADEQNTGAEVTEITQDILDGEPSGDKDKEVLSTALAEAETSPDIADVLDDILEPDGILKQTQTIPAENTSPPESESEQQVEMAETDTQKVADSTSEGSVLTDSQKVRQVAAIAVHKQPASPPPQAANALKVAPPVSEEALAAPEPEAKPDETSNLDVEADRPHVDTTQLRPLVPHDEALRAEDDKPDEQESVLASLVDEEPDTRDDESRPVELQASEQSELSFMSPAEPEDQPAEPENSAPIEPIRVRPTKKVTLKRSTDAENSDTNLSQSPHINIGEKLRCAREELKLEVADVAKTTHIRTDFIKMLEEGKVEELPVAPIYTKSYVKTLCQAYKLNPANILSEVESQLGTSTRSTQTFEPPSSTPISTPLYKASTDDEEEDKSRKESRLPTILWAIGLPLVLLIGIMLFNLVSNRISSRAAEVTEGMPLISSQDLEVFIVPEIPEPAEELPIPE